MNWFLVTQCSSFNAQAQINYLCRLVSEAMKCHSSHMHAQQATWVTNSAERFPPSANNSVDFISYRYAVANQSFFRPGQWWKVLQDKIVIFAYQNRSQISSNECQWNQICQYQNHQNFCLTGSTILIFQW